MSIEFWKAAGIRALRTVCQTAIATIGTSAMIQDVNWMMVGSASLLSGILSILTSIATDNDCMVSVEVLFGNRIHARLVSSQTPQRGTRSGKRPRLRNVRELSCGNA